MNTLLPVTVTKHVWCELCYQIHIFVSFQIGMRNELFGMYFCFGMYQMRRGNDKWAIPKQMFLSGIPPLVSQIKKNVIACCELSCQIHFPFVIDCPSSPGTF